MINNDDDDGGDGNGDGCFVRSYSLEPLFGSKLSFHFTISICLAAGCCELKKIDIYIKTALELARKRETGKASARNKNWK